MNGFANAILTLLLSWMRVLVNDLWRLLSSEDAGLFYRFLAANWKVIVLILCAGGFVIDRIIYLIRWRPYYVWSSRLGRLKRARAARHGDVYPEEDAIPPEEEPSASPDGQEVPFPDDSASYAPGAFDQAYPQDFGATRAYAPAQDFAPGSQAPAMNQATVQYAPLEQGPLYAPYSQPYQPPQDLDPVFDETEERWEEGDALVRPLWDNPAEGMDSSFGAPRPEPIQSIRDMQAGFAPPRPPEELYAPPPVPTRSAARCGIAAGTSRPGCGGVPRTSGPDAADAPFFHGGGKRGYAGGAARHEAAGIPSLYHARRRPGARLWRERPQAAGQKGARSGRCGRRGSPSHHS